MGLEGNERASVLHLPAPHPAGSHTVNASNESPPAGDDRPADSTEDAASSRHARIDRARELIGAGRQGDFELAPTLHAAQYDSGAPELARLLRTAPIQVAAERYEAKDAEAVLAQERFRSTWARARAAVLLTGLAAALILVTGALSTLLDENVARFLPVPFSILGVVSGGLAGMWIRQIRDGRLLEAWMTRRAEAETERLRYFELVTAADPPVDEPLLKLEYFRRYQLDAQRAYYGARARQHRADADRALSRGSAGMAVGGIGSGVAGILAAAFSPVWTALAGIGLAGQAFGSAAEHDEATVQSRRNAERFGRTKEALDHLYAKLDRVRAAVADGEPPPLDAFVESVHEQLSLEHRQWLEGIGGVGRVVDRLEELLEKHSQTHPGGG